MPKLSWTIGGMALVLKNLDIHNTALGLRCHDGLLAAGRYLQSESMKLTPVEFDTLRGSAYAEPIKGTGFDSVVEVGYRAGYAVYVHEKVGMVLKGKPRKGTDHIGFYWDPQGQAQAKFLEEPARRLQPQMLAIIKSIAQIP